MKKFNQFISESFKMSKTAERKLESDLNSFLPAPGKNGFVKKNNTYTFSSKGYSEEWAYDVYSGFTHSIPKSLNAGNGGTYFSTEGDDHTNFKISGRIAGGAKVSGYGKLVGDKMVVSITLK